MNKQINTTTISTEEYYTLRKFKEGVQSGYVPLYVHRSLHSDCDYILLTKERAEELINKEYQEMKDRISLLERENTILKYKNDSKDCGASIKEVLFEILSVALVIAFLYGTYLYFH